MRDASKAFIVFRQNMGLFVGNHLNAMFYIAEKVIFFGEAIAGFFADPAALCELSEHRDSLITTQFREPSACNQLLCLHKEFDLADATTTELHIMAANGNIAVPLMGVDLPLDGMDVGDCRVVEIFAPNVRGQLGQHLFAGLTIPGNRARFDHRRTFPILPAPFIIMKGCTNWDR